MSEQAIVATADVFDASDAGDGAEHAPKSGVRRPPPMIEVASVRRAKRTIALVTILVPTFGTALALGLAVARGIGALELGLLVGMYIVTMTGVEVGFHRYFAHSAFKGGEVLRALLGVAGSMAAQGPVIYWAATHRRHHVYSDTKEDPHSPHVRKADSGSEQRFTSRLAGLWHSQMGNMYTDHATNVMAFSADLRRSRLNVFIDRHYRKWVLFGLILPALIGAAVERSLYGALMGLLWGGLVRIFVVHHIYFANGSFSHMYGGRPFKTDDESTNNYVFGVPTFGSAWQNNHHAFPSSANLGFKWYQPDVGYFIIRALAALGVVTSMNRAPTAQEQAGKARIPAQAVRL